MGKERRLYATLDEVLRQEYAIVKQGAEAIVCTTSMLPGEKCIAKFRPHKAYRHPVLDARLTQRRCVGEARLLQRARLHGVDVPTLLALDVAKGLIFMEWIDGLSVRDILGTRDISRVPVSELHELHELMRRVGAAVARLHASDIVHGDLTTSNLMTRLPAGGVGHAAQGPVVIIDLGLGQVSNMDEDKAVDLYVLERAFASTHPNSYALHESVLSAYCDAYAGAPAVMRRLEDVRARGRKRTMVG